MARDELLEFYPSIKPYNTGRLKVSEIHEIYFEESGNPEGKPVLIVHGGPGGGSNGLMRRYHDPDHYRIIFIKFRQFTLVEAELVAAGRAPIQRVKH